MSGNPYLNKPQDKYASATISKKATTIATSNKGPGSAAPTAPIQNKQERVSFHSNRSVLQGHQVTNSAFYILQSPKSFNSIVTVF